MIVIVDCRAVYAEFSETDRSEHLHEPQTAGSVRVRSNENLRAPLSKKQVCLSSRKMSAVPSEVGGSVKHLRLLHPARP